MSRDGGLTRRLAMTAEREKYDEHGDIQEREFTRKMGKFQLYWLNGQELKIAIVCDRQMLNN